MILLVYLLLVLIQVPLLPLWTTQTDIRPEAGCSFTRQEPTSHLYPHNFTPSIYRPIPSPQAPRSPSMEFRRNPAHDLKSTTCPSPDSPHVFARQQPTWSVNNDDIATQWSTSPFPVALLVENLFEPHLDVLITNAVGREVLTSPSGLVPAARVFVVVFDEVASGGVRVRHCD